MHVIPVLTYIVGIFINSRLRSSVFLTTAWSDGTTDKRKRVGIRRHVGQVHD